LLRPPHSVDKQTTPSLSKNITFILLYIDKDTENKLKDQEGLYKIIYKVW
jgi:hypothetical protein